MTASKCRTMILAMIMTLENEEERSFVETLYHKYEKQMLNICMSVLKNNEDAKEAVSDTFVRIMLNVTPFMESESLEGLVMVTTKHVAINYYNKKKKRSDHEFNANYFDDEEENVLLDIEDTSASIEQAIMDHDFIFDVKSLLRDMPSEVSTIIIYKYLYRYRNTEIADMLGMDRAMVNVKLQRARQKLREMLAERYSKA